MIYSLREKLLHKDGSILSQHNQSGNQSLLTKKASAVTEAFGSISLGKDIHMIKVQENKVKKENSDVRSNKEVSGFLWDLMMKGKDLVFRGSILSRCHNEKEVRAAFSEARNLGLQVIR